MREFQLDVKVFIGDNFQIRQKHLLAEMRMPCQLWLKDREWGKWGTQALKWLKSRGLEGNPISHVVRSAFSGEFSQFADFFLECPEMAVPIKHIPAVVDLLINDLGPQSRLFLSTESDTVAESLKLAHVEGKIKSLEFIHVFEGDNGEIETQTFQVDKDGTLSDWPEGFWLETLHIRQTKEGKPRP